MDDLEVEALWDIVSQLLKSGQTRLAYCFFRVALRTIRLCTLKYSQTDILLLESEPLPGRPALVFEEYIDKSWGIVLMTYTYGPDDFSRKCFETELRKVQRKTYELCHQQEAEPYVIIHKADL